MSTPVKSRVELHNRLKDALEKSKADDSTKKGFSKEWKAEDALQAVLKVLKSEQFAFEIPQTEPEVRLREKIKEVISQSVTLSTQVKMGDETITVPLDVVQSELLEDILRVR